MTIDDTLPDVVPSDYFDPDWKNAGKAHDWKNYVPDWMQKRWGAFTRKERILVAFMADEQAGSEEWD